MATDKRLDQVSTLTDFDYALIVKGDQVAKASKQQLAELVGNLLYGATNASSLATVVAELMGWKGIHKAITSPSVSTEAVCIAAIQAPDGFYGASFELRYTGFRYAANVLFSFYKSGQSLTIYAYQTGVEVDKGINKFYYKVQDKVVYIYVTGTYQSKYTASVMDLWSSDKKVSFDVDNTVFPVDEIFLSIVETVPLFRMATSE